MRERGRICRERARQRQTERGAGERGRERGGGRGRETMGGESVSAARATVSRGNPHRPVPLAALIDDNAR